MKLSLLVCQQRHPHFPDYSDIIYGSDIHNNNIPLVDNGLSATKLPFDRDYEPDGA